MTGAFRGLNQDRLDTMCLSWTINLSKTLVRNLLLFNCALLGKWLWSFVHEGESLWRTVMDNKYSSSWGGWCSNEVHRLYEMGLLKNIKKGWG